MVPRPQRVNIFRLLILTSCASLASAAQISELRRSAVPRLGQTAAESLAPSSSVHSFKRQVSHSAGTFEASNLVAAGRARRNIKSNEKTKLANGPASSAVGAPTMNATSLRIHLTGIHVDRAEFPLSRFLFKLSLRLALKSISRQLEEEHRVKLSLSVRGASSCSHQFAAAIAAEEYYSKSARLFIVSGCDDAVRSVSRFASRWQVPVITSAGFGADLSDKSVHRSLIRVAFSLPSAVEFLFKIMKTFQWRRVNLIVDESDANSVALRGSIERHQSDFAQITTGANGTTTGASQTGKQTGQASLKVVALDFQSLLKAPADNRSSSFDADRWPSELMERAVSDALRQCSMYSRVIILLIPQVHLRKFMLSVYDQNMANGLYTFINLPLILAAPLDQGGQERDAAGPSAGATQASYSTSTGDNVFLWRAARSTRNAQAKQAFASLMSIYSRTPTTKAYIYFANRLNNLANTEYSATTTTTAAPGHVGAPRASGPAAGQSKSLQLNVNPYLASFYDGLQIYAIALNESLHQLKHEQRVVAGRDGARAGNYSRLLHSRISNLVQNRRFDNMVTGRLYINPNGDRETDYTLDDMNQMTGKFAPVILYRGETRAIERLARIQWSSDGSAGPTSDTVDCNLDSSCPSKPMSTFVLVLSLMAGPLVLCISSLFYFVYSRLSLESQLVDYWWKIRMSEVEIVLTRRKNANDGSLVITPTLISDSKRASGIGYAQKTASISSNSRGSGKLRSNDSATLGAAMVVGAGSKFESNTMITNRSRNTSLPCDKTEVTKLTHQTDTSLGLMSGALSPTDVCYGNITLGIHKLSKVALKPLRKFHQSRKLMLELRSIKEINHINLCRFVGIIVDEGKWAIVSEFCPKGSLREFFHNESMVIDWTFKYSIINDILAGLNYIHSSQLCYHGRLKSSNCLVGARFVVKLSDYGPHSLYNQVDESLPEARQAKGQSYEGDLGENGSLGLENVDERAARTRAESEEDLLIKKRLWLAPEHLNKSTKSIGSTQGDIYSFGLLLYEIVTSTLPFYDIEKDDYVMPLKDLYLELKSHGPNETIGPDVSDLTNTEENANIESLVELMKTCWSFEPNKRPNLQAVNASIKKFTHGITSRKLLENLTSRMEQYTNNLESLVEAKLATLVEEKLMTEELFYQFVPKSIAAALKEGQFVEPEAFDCVTVFYSDIVGFTSLSSESSPMEVVDFLSELYLCFDEILEQHDIFKVDTIGDAYIVASGLPQRNEDKHVVEIARAALELRDRLRCFKIPHRPDRNLEMRVGIHSGPCIAGIVGGLNMPKYCVFGDTLTTGKFMESTGQPMKIHITEESKNLLANVDGFSIEPRQPKVTRDGLPLQTYWLEKGCFAEA